MKYARLVKKIYLQIPFACFLLLVFTGSGCDFSKEEASSICAQVNEKRIYIKDFEQELQRLNLDTQEATLEFEDQIKHLKKELLLNMIDKELLIQEARSRGIQAADRDLEVYLKELARGYPSKKFSIQSQLKDPEYTDKRSFILEGILIKRLINQLIEPSLHISDEEMSSFFLAHKQEFALGKAFRVRQIVVESEMEARQIRGLLKKGHDFAELAQQRSLSPDRDAGGDLGFFGLGEMPPEFDEVVLSLKEDEISDIIQSDYGYHIFQLLEIRQPQEPNWEEAKPKIEKILLTQKREEAFQNFLAELKSRARIKIYPNAIF